MTIQSLKLHGIAFRTCYRETAGAAVSDGDHRRGTQGVWCVGRRDGYGKAGSELRRSVHRRAMGLWLKLLAICDC